jgi:CHAT domain-containing protein/Tfp pilus assembly protein PilF
VFACVTALISAAGARGFDDRPRGVIAEGVDRYFSAERAGVQRGDVLLRWVGNNAKGEIHSPFDIISIEIEQAPHGTVTLEGLRHGRNRIWFVGPDRWGLRTYPEPPRSLPAIYQECRHLALAGKALQAAQSCNEAAVAAEKKDYAELSSWLMYRAALLWAQQRRWREADEAYAQAIHLTPEANSSFTALLLREWASTFRQRNDWTHAEDYFKKSIQLSQNSGTYLTAAVVFDDLGMMFWTRSDLKKAEEYCRQALEIRTRLSPNSLAQARSLTSVGTVVRYPRGIGLQVGQSYYEQALAIEQKLAPEGLDAALTLENLGIVAWQTGDLARAQKYLHHALNIQERLSPEGLDVAGSLNELGTVADLQGDQTKAKRYLLRSLAIRQEKDPGSWAVSQSVHDLGLLAQEHADLPRAEKYTQQALEIDRELANDSLDVAGDLNDLSYIAHDRGDLVRAEEYQRQALAIEEKEAPGGLYVAETLHGLGDLLSQNGDFSGAQGYYEQSLAIREKLVPGSEDHAATLAGLALVLRKEGQFARAETFYEQTLHALASQTARLGGSDELRSDFRARHANYYKNYVDLLLAENRPDTALEILEQSRARMLLEMMSAAHVDLRNDVDPQLSKKEERLQAELAAKSDGRIRLLSGKHTDQQVSALQQEIARLLSERSEVEEQMRASSPRYAALTKPQPISAKEIQQLLDQDTVLLEYSLGDERSHVWVVTSDRLTSYELPNRVEIEAAARSVYNLLTAPNRMSKDETEQTRQARLNRDEKRFRFAAAALSRVVLAPVAAYLGNKRLLIVTDGALQYIPFSALPIASSSDSAKGLGSQKLVPLITEHEVVNLPSISVLAALRREELTRVRAPKSVAVLADPVFDKEDARVGGTRSQPADGRQEKFLRSFWSSPPASRLLRSASDVGLLEGKGSGTDHELHLSRLWFSRLEADAILSVTPPGQGMKAVDFKANRTVATSPELTQYRIIHFATHGLLDSRNPELSGLVFSMVDARGRPQNGFLDIQDIYNLKLPAEMVVLSACETGLGKEIDGEGLVGLTQGFMHAGASRVVASLWRVSDMGTAQLMGEFYKAMERDGMRPAAALRQAQIGMWKQKRWASPYYWAGFQIQGEWN